MNRGPIPLYQPTWNSLRQHHTPEWFRDAKFGIYTHWGLYSVPACGWNGTWYPYNMYREGNGQYDHHVKTYGGPEKFGYKDFIPMFTAEKFDPDEWAEMFKKAGARFAGPVGEHHDGFCMWDTKYSEWNSVRMGPKRDVVGELERAIRKQDMRYFVALHHAENWWFFPHWRKEFDTSDPKYAGLYGEFHNPDGPKQFDQFQFFDQDMPSRAFLELWLNKTLEVIDKYQPDILWFDGAIQGIEEQYRLDFLAYYYNKAEAWGRETVACHKWEGFPPNVAMLDLELGREDALSFHEWLTDTTVDDGAGWSYITNTGYKSPETVVHYLIDNVSKNGYLLLNVGPKPDGTIPEQAQAILAEMGRWLDTNGEAIYGTTAWLYYGEGPTKLAKMEGGERPQYVPQDIRFTTKDDALYATCLAWPKDGVTITRAKDWRPYSPEELSVTMLGSDEPIAWRQTEEGLLVHPPKERPCDHAYVFKIVRPRR
jgi:alpha-L-fucosidase